MAQLFQPTNITPDTRGAFGNGVILRASSGSTYFDVSWQINGNAPMTAYKIDFMDMSGTLLFSTGKLELATPEYGMSADGEPKLFYHGFGPIPSTSQFLQQSDGLIRITQWWGNGANDYVQQISPSHYIVRDAFRVTVSPDSAPGASRIGTFSGSFAGAEEDGIMWLRWVLSESETGNVIKDTGKLYGAVEPAFSYDGFLPGEYRLTLYAETSAGVQDDGTYTFTVDYSMEESDIKVLATRDCDGESAVSVRWPRFSDIPLTSFTGTPTDDGTTINLPTSNDSLEWHIVNRSPMNFEAPWSAIWSGLITEESGKIFSIQTNNATYESYVGEYNESRAIYVVISPNSGTASVAVYYIAWVEGPFMCIITPDTIYWKGIAASGGPLYPLEDLYPSGTLYPGYSGDLYQFTAEKDIEGWIKQTNVTSVSLFGPSSVYYFEIFDHGLTEREANRYLSGELTGSYDIDTYFFINPRGADQDYNAGNFPDNLQDGTIVSIYRQTGDSAYLEYVGKTTVGAKNKILDYAARSQQGPYKYYLYVLSSDKYINIPSKSNETNPCFWNWTVLSCKENTDGSFAVQSSYNFGKNLQTGQVSNNNQPGIFKNFTPYPTVMIAPQNYRSGTLQSLIGIIKDEGYSDTIDLRNAIYSLSTSTSILFLKSRKGDLIRIRPGGEINMDTMDNTVEQAQTVGFPWVEVGDASRVAIYSAGESV